MAIILVAIGSNRCHGRHGRPEGVVRAAIAALPAVAAASPIIATTPLGPGTRRYANAVVALVWDGPLLALLAQIKALERAFGRRRGRRWGDRVLDIDIIAAGTLVVSSTSLTLPHPAMAQRRFVLDPLVAVAPGWRDPVSGLTARQLRARLLRPKALPRT
jgi:2-amino-4-hydroxy-6-hydroxymethyldihydropteridine diphosphokinase